MAQVFNSHAGGGPPAHETRRALRPRCQTVIKLRVKLIEVIQGFNLDQQAPSKKDREINIERTLVVKCRLRHVSITCSFSGPKDFVNRPSHRRCCLSINEDAQDYLAIFSYGV